jgi:broad specificity phosphatase PhoE
LIRHGEAAHNVEEKRAEKRVLAESAALGLGADHPETRERSLLARQAILEDERFFDAPLTSQGEDEARQAHARIAAWTTKTTAAADDDSSNPQSSSLLLPAPQEVFVSPLRRALRTADLIFPPSTATAATAQQEQQQSQQLTTTTTPIHVYENLRERLTGRPADNRFASHVLANCFKRFDFHHLRINSIHHNLVGAANNNHHHNSDDCDNDTTCNKNDNSKSPTSKFVEEREQPMMRRATLYPFNDIDKEDADDAKADDEEHWLESILNSEKRGRRSRTTSRGGHARSATATTLDISPSGPTTTNSAARLQKQSSSCNTDTATEDNEKLQERAVQLFDLLAQYSSDSVAIVTHKGFLRELEHGCLGLTETKEFENCEVRVYRARFQIMPLLPMTEESSSSSTTMILEEIDRLK